MTLEPGRTFKLDPRYWPFPIDDLKVAEVASLTLDVIKPRNFQASGQMVVDVLARPEDPELPTYKERRFLRESFLDETICGNHAQVVS